MKSGYSKTETYPYRIHIGYRYSTDIRGYDHEVSKLIILIFNKYFIGYLCDTPQIHKDTSKVLHRYVS